MKNAFKHLGQNLEINYLSCTDIKPYKNNPRTHSKAQIKQIAQSIQEFGFTNPLLLDHEQNIIAGHGRLEAAQLLNLKQVPAIYLRHLTEAQKKAYIIADNKLAENAGWDIEILSSELEAIHELDIDFDLTLTGFETPEIDGFLLNHDDSQEEALPLPPQKPVSQLGDLWILGKHRLLCADATAPDSYAKLMAGDKARTVFTDPPYNVKISGHVCGNGKVQHDEFKMASGEMSEREFKIFLTSITQHLVMHSMDGSLHYICMDWRHMKELLSAGSYYTELKNLCVWNKTNGGMGSLYRSKHELVFVYKNGSSPHINNVELGKHGRYRTNVWDYAGVNTFQNTEDLKLHPTVKPVAMVKDAILDSTTQNDIILDPFGGSGSTLIAAEESDRRAYLMELDPKYIDVIIERYQKATGDSVRHENGLSFEEVKGQRHEL